MTREELQGIASRIAHTRPKLEPQIPNMVSAQRRGEIRQAHTDAYMEWLNLTLKHAEEIALDYLAVLEQLRK